MSTTISLSFLWGVPHIDHLQHHLTLATFHSLHRKRVEMEKDCEFVLLGPGDVVINITNNNLDCLPDLNTYLCNEGGEGRSSTTMEEVYCKRKSTEEERAAPLSSFAQTRG